jgi:2',3'-cyclic-nucleotide 2'-phosphodiesterase (5'-nucleotidase family)
LRNSLPKGDITIGNVFELMPFDNEVVLLKLSGAQFKDMCFKIVEKGGIPIGGMRLIMKGSTPTDIFVNGKPFDETKDYWVVTSDYLANGGDSYIFFKDALDRKNLNILLRNMIIEYCNDVTKLNQTIKPKLDGRIQLSK